MMELMPHIKLSQNDAAPYVLLPGDPARVDRIASHLEKVEKLAWNREFSSIRGTFHSVPVLAVSTGLGGPSAATAVEELSKIGVKYFIRIGSCGALTQDAKLGDLILVTAAIRDDGTSKAYADTSYPAVSDYLLLKACEESTKSLNVPFHIGLCRSHDSLYAPEKAVKNELCSKQGVLGSDMETAAIFVCAALKGLHAASILNVVVEHNTALAQNINLYTDGEALTSQGEQNEILTALNAFVRIHNATHTKGELL